MSKEKKEALIFAGLYTSIVFAVGFACGCKYMNIDRAFKAYLKKPGITVRYF